MAPDPRPHPFVRAPLGIALGVPAALAVLLGLVALQGWDTPLFLFFNSLPQATGASLWAYLTILGDGLLVAALFLPWIRRHPERVWAGLLGALVMVLILRSFKGLLPLPRPLGVLPEEMLEVIGPGHRRSAFPSGHTSAFFLFAGVWALSTPRRWLSLALLVAASLVGISRMAVGVHWPSDVLGGAFLGWSSAWLGLRAAARWPWGTRPWGRRLLAGCLGVATVVLLIIDHTGYPGVLPLQRGIALACLGLGAREFLLDFRGDRPSGFSPPEMED